MWGSEKGTAGTGTSRRHKWAHSPSSPQSSQKLGAPTLPGPLRAPSSPGAPSCCTCLARGGPACSSLSAGGRDAKELVGPGRCRVGAGSAQPTQVWPRRLRQQSSAPGWPRLAGWQEPPAPLAAPGRAGTPRHYPTAAAGSARAERGRQGRHGQVGTGTARSHRPPAPGHLLCERGGLRPLPAGAPPRPIDAPDAWGRQPGSDPAAAQDVPCGSAAHNDPIEVPRGGGWGTPKVVVAEVTPVSRQASILLFIPGGGVAFEGMGMEALPTPPCRMPGHPGGQRPRAPRLSLPTPRPSPAPAPPGRAPAPRPAAAASSRPRQELGSPWGLQTPGCSRAK